MPLPFRTAKTFFTKSVTNKKTPPLYNKAFVF